MNLDPKTSGLILHRKRPNLSLLLAVLLAAPLLVAQSPARRTPPPTRAEPVRETIHGVGIADSYRWLEDQQSPETRSWIDRKSVV